MALKTTIGKKEWLLLKMIAREGDRDFEDLNPKEKWIVYNSTVDITDVVDKEQIENYERAMGIRPTGTKTGKISKLINKAAHRIRFKLED